MKAVTEEKNWDVKKIRKDFPGFVADGEREAARLFGQQRFVAGAAGRYRSRIKVFARGTFQYPSRRALPVAALRRPRTKRPAKR